jgi:uncharacterized protein YbjT (DUF2867 family)
MRVLVTGITGAIGRRLAPRLRADGHEVRGLSRGCAAPAAAPGVKLFRGDAITAQGLDAALEGVEVAYYLIHSMEPSAGGPFPERERVAAENLVRAARRAGVRRIVYLGGLIPQGTRPSRHLASRLAVENVLLTGTPDSVAFRASIVIGASSRSFRFLVRLVERLPVLVLPAWRENRTAPIDERDVISFLALAATSLDIGGRSLDISGPDTVTYAQLIERLRDAMLLNRPVLEIPRLALTPIASRISALIAGEEHELIGPLMEGLEGDLLPRDQEAVALLPVRRHPLDRAIERALRDWEAVEALRAR